MQKRSRGPDGVFSWDIDSIAIALKIGASDVRAYFTDGRRISFLLERRLVKEVVKGSLAPSEGQAFDLIDPDGGKWEVRSISRGGVYFCPSYMVGSGRKFDEKGFLDKISEIKGFILSDIEKFPEIPYWIIASKDIYVWWESGQLGSTTKISREKALSLLSSGT